MKTTLRQLRMISFAGALAAAAVLAAGVAATASAASTSTCPPPPTTSQVFKAWGDTHDYAAMPSGSFEGSLSGWSTAGTSATSGNEPWYVHSKSDSHSEVVGSGGVVTTSPICEPLLQPVLRLFVRNTGVSTGRLHVQFLVNQNNTLYVLDAGYWSFGSSWALSPIIAAQWTGPLSGALQVRLTAVGTGASFQIDDVYVDPYLSR
jgi:hypothetical protein